jgi:hypothetical protein
MLKKHIKYKEGQWFAIPLKNGGYATGIIVRGSYMTKGGLGYFFGPKYKEIPSYTETYQKNKDNPILIGWFGDLGIIKGDWPIIENGRNFIREDWPVPKFQRKSSLTEGKVYVVEYGQNNEVHDSIREILVPINKEILKYPEDGLYGSEAIEKELEKLLKEEIKSNC